MFKQNRQIENILTVKQDVITKEILPTQIEHRMYYDFEVRKKFLNFIISIQFNPIKVLHIDFFTFFSLCLYYNFRNTILQQYL